MGDPKIDSQRHTHTHTSSDAGRLRREIGKISLFLDAPAPGLYLEPADEPCSNFDFFAVLKESVVLVGGGGSSVSLLL